MHRIVSGTTDQYVYFQASTGLSTFTVWRSRNNGTPVQMTTPAVVEKANMPGIYSLLLDEDMTVDAGNVTEHMAFLVTAAGMTAKLIEVELFVANVSHMNLAPVQGTGTAGNLWRGV